MEGVVMAPGSANARLKSRVRNNSARGTKNRQPLNRNHSMGHGRNNGRNNLTRAQNCRNNANHRHLNNINNKNQTAAVVVDNNGNGAHDSKIICFGNFTREVYNAICPRLGHTLHIPEESVQALFNDMQLYPSKSQVSEMLQCARQCGRRNGAAKFITFGEFCVLVREMQHRKIPQCKTSNKCTSNCEVFLGGSCNPTTWRMDTAIPELQKYGITYYNPQVSMWAPELIALEHNAKQAASVLLFVVDSQTRSTGGMIEVAYLVASGRCVVLVAHPYRQGQSIMGETLTQGEFRDLVEGQASLLTLVKSRGIKVHSNLSSALQCTANILRNSTDNGVSSEEQIMNKLRKLRETFDSYGGQTGEIKFYDALKAFEKLSERPLNISEIKEMAKYLLPTNGDNSAGISLDNARISFERFCTVMAEFTTDRCDTTTCTNRDAWAAQSFQRQCSTNNNSCNIVNNAHMDEDIEPSEEGGRHDRDAYDVFLGGTCNSLKKWRRDIAIPLLKKHGITYYNPAIREKNGYEVLDNGYNNSPLNNEDDVLKYKQVMDRSKVLLFVAPDDARSLTTMILAAHYIGLGKNVVLAIQRLPENGCVIQNETQTLQAVKDYNRGREYLADLAKRKSVAVFENITEAVQCVVDLCQGG